MEVEDPQVSPVKAVGSKLNATVYVSLLREA